MRKISAAARNLDDNESQPIFKRFRFICLVRIANCNTVRGKKKGYSIEIMGSASLIPHLQLHGCFYKRLDSVRNEHQQFPSLQLNINSKRRGRLRFDAPHTRSTSFRRVVCFAAVDDDVSEKQQQQQDSTSTSSLLEDRPGKIIHNNPISQISFFSFLIIGITLSFIIGIEENRIFLWFIYVHAPMLCKKAIFCEVVLLSAVTCL